VSWFEELPPELARHAEGCVPAGCRLVSVREVPRKDFYRQMDVEVEYPNGERVWLQDAPLAEAHMVDDHPILFIFGDTPGWKMAMLGAE
jgi:hypothetical protein